MASTIEFQEVALEYKDTRALDGVSSTLEGGCTYGLIGRNGAGKTSLLSLIASYRKPTGGRVLIDGIEPFEQAEQMQKVWLAYSWDMSEESDSIATTLKQNAAYRPDYDLDYAFSMLERFGLDPKKALNKLSVGMQAAYSVIEAFAVNAPITIFDEVHHGMDAPSRQLFYEMVLEAREKFQRTMILSTHLVSEMAYLFDHVLVLHRGRLLADEPYDTLVERGVTITGPEEPVEAFIQGYQEIDRKRLGRTLSVMLYGILKPEDMERARRAGLEVSPVSLQELFIHMTKERSRT